MKKTLLSLYDKAILARPILTLLIIAACVAWLGIQAQALRIDISADSLVLENDADLNYYRSMSGRYAGDDFLIVTYTPKADLFTQETLADLKQLRDELAAMERVSSVTSALDAPLLQSPPVTLADIQKETRTLLTPGLDLEMARRELTSSPLYSNLLVGKSGKTTAIQLNFKRDPIYVSLLTERDQLRSKRLEPGFSAQEQQRLDSVTLRFKEHSDALADQEERDIAAIRAIMARHADKATLHLGGAPMIVNDMIHFVRHDIRTFGLAVLGMLALLLWIAFRSALWVILPMITAVAASVSAVGLFALFGWKITIVSSNFPALLLIFILSLSIHLAVRHRELHRLHPDADQRFLVLETVKSKFTACLYMVLTTAVAFGSLVVSGVRPVIDFGWMMSVSLAVALLLAFTLLPAALMLIKPGRPQEERDYTAVVSAWLPRVIERRGGAIMLAAALFTVLGALGLRQLTVENRFIDNFKESTEIHQGMLLIDRELGGTISLDVIVNPPPKRAAAPVETAPEETAKTAPAAANDPLAVVGLAPATTSAQPAPEDPLAVVGLAPASKPAQPALEDPLAVVGLAPSTTPKPAQSAPQDPLAVVGLAPAPASQDPLAVVGLTQPPPAEADPLAVVGLSAKTLAAEAPLATDPGITGRSYWFNSFMAEDVRRIHDYLDGIPEVGKVLSLATTMEILKQINGGQMLDDVTLSILYERLCPRT
ncbi:efflux RND transporter permease subunit [Magnetofaba australis]|nr:MMPL family transporter [Magnetofaba australis]